MHESLLLAPSLQFPCRPIRSEHPRCVSLSMVLQCTEFADMQSDKYHRKAFNCRSGVEW